ncbi:hypothetical protein [Paracoccus aminovorans]|uniref:hypothetical protein n=1 Tax=Paracoccus aminovorans TaxID=34004 RepID=UPI002B259DB3|nr:hypothetical protein [Paracoccus aminovorans]
MPADTLRRSYCSAGCADAAKRAREMAACREGRAIPTQCAHCGGELDGSDIRRKFCGKECQNAYFNALAKQARLEEKEGRSCILCRQPIPIQGGRMRCIAVTNVASVT